MNIAVLGGGLSGRLMALMLAERGVSVSLFCAGTASGEDSAAYVAAAMLAPLAESVDAEPQVTALGRQSLPLWREIVARLPEPVFMQENGSLLVWHAQDKALSVQFERKLQRVGGQAERWQRDEIAAHEPQLADRFTAGLYLAGEGQLDNRQTLLALAAGLVQCGVSCFWQHRSSPEALSKQFDWVVDCRGIGAREDWNALPHTPLRGIRGEVARVYAPEISLNRPVRLLHPRYPLYIAPKQNHVFVIGATQIESEHTAPVSVRSGLELLSALYAVHPAFGEADILELAASLRPTLAHHRPEIRFNINRRQIAINGLFRHGFMIAPAVCAAAVRLAETLFSGGVPSYHDAESGLAFERWHEAA